MRDRTCFPPRNCFAFNVPFSSKGTTYAIRCGDVSSKCTEVLMTFSAPCLSTSHFLARAKYFSPLGSSIVLKYSGLAPIKYSTAKTASARCLAGMRLLMPSETSLAVLISCKFSWERLGSALGVLRVL